MTLHDLISSTALPLCVVFSIFAIRFIFLFSMMIRAIRKERAMVKASGFKKKDILYFAPADSLCVIEVKVKSFDVGMGNTLLVTAVVQNTQKDDGNVFPFKATDLFKSERDAAKRALDNIIVKEKLVNELKERITRQLPLMHQLAYGPDEATA